MNETMQNKSVFSCEESNLFDGTARLEQQQMMFDALIALLDTPPAAGSESDIEIDADNNSMILKTPSSQLMGAALGLKAWGELLCLTFSRDGQNLTISGWSIELDS